MNPRKLLRNSVLLTAVSMSPLLLVGCAAQPKQPVVPTTSHLAASGNGDLSYRANEDCTLYLFDQPNNRLVWSGPLMNGQMFMLNHDLDTLTVDSKVVQDKTPDIGNDHRIFIDTTMSPMRIDVRDDARRTVPAY